MRVTVTSTHFADYEVNISVTYGALYDASFFRNVLVTKEAQIKIWDYAGQRLDWNRMAVNIFRFLLVILFYTLNLTVSWNGDAEFCIRIYSDYSDNTTVGIFAALICNCTESSARMARGSDADITFPSFIHGDIDIGDIG